MATSLCKGQIPFRAKGQTTCLHHKEGQLDVYCKKCQELVCMKCLSTVHNGHPLCGLSEIASEKKRDIQNFIDKTEKADLVQVDKYITATDAQLKDNCSNFEKLSHQLKTQTNKLKEDLDLLTAQTLSLYQQMEEDNTKLLQTYKQDLEMYSTQLKKQVQKCKIALQRCSDIQIYDTGCEIQSSTTLPVKPTLGTASFTPNLNPQSHLEQALGRISTSGHLQGQASRDHDRSIGSSAGQGPSPTQQWKGKVIQEVECNTKIPDISLSPTTNTLWVCDKENNIQYQGDTNELFVYDGEVPHTYQPTSQSGGKPFDPCGAVYDTVGNIVIGDFNNKSVLLISGRGEFLRIIHTDDDSTVAVGVEREDVLWAVFGFNDVKLLQYSSV
ncbi:uncharacterized protein LOC110457144 [Mizuhopecten yessoensis]|uniref:uncharacterized protein LOC110457144 n=1 Tax=Mizuhopecten yessoensis TaxID=6573 RepID=UPI000B4589AC|nr:uncharacterized protein LOC110457144 [Mizuhopecten yessoensis]